MRYCLVMRPFCHCHNERNWLLMIHASLMQQICCDLRKINWTWYCSLYISIIKEKFGTKKILILVLDVQRSPMTKLSEAIPTFTECWRRAWKAELHEGEIIAVVIVNLRVMDKAAESVCASWVGSSLSANVSRHDNRSATRDRQRTVG